MNDLKATHTFEIRLNAGGDKLCLANPSNDDSCAYRIAGTKAWGGSTLIEDIEIKESDLVTYIKDYAPHLASFIADKEINQLQQRITELEERNSHLEAQIASKDAELPKWISVDERLPDYGVPVLLKINGIAQHVIYMRDGSDESNDWFESYHYEDKDSVFFIDFSDDVEWMPLPPKEKDDE